MKSRKAPIVAAADTKSVQLIESVGEDRPRFRSNLEAIHQICRSLVTRKTPISPTAGLIAEEGLLTDPDFPSTQTIYNSYGQMTRIWRRAYLDLRNVNAPDPLTASQVFNVDVSPFDEGAKAIIAELQRHMKELIQRNNALKDIIYREVPVYADGVPTEITDALKELAAWLDLMQGSAFYRDGGLFVARTTPVGTIVMGARQFASLRRMTAMDEAAKRSKDL